MYKMEMKYSQLKKNKKKILFFSLSNQLVTFTRRKRNV